MYIYIYIYIYVYIYLTILRLIEQHKSFLVLKKNRKAYMYLSFELKNNKIVIFT